jgi:multicomponent Na+:H+ antiporter subunit G
MHDLANAAAHTSDGLSFSLAVAFFVFGGASVLVGAVGLLRFRDVYMRLHAVALGSALGAPLLLAGFAAAAWDWRISLKLLLLGGLVAALAPAASHILASAAHGSGLAPRTDASP